MRLPEDQREELAAQPDEIEKRAAEARTGAPGIAWDEIKRDLLK